MKEQIAIVGPGALGLVLAAVLSENGGAVLLFDHDGARAGRLGSAGVRVSGPGERPERGVALSVTSDPGRLGGAAIIIICVKAHADAQVARLLEGVPPETPVLTLGNGLGRGEALEGLGRLRILVGTTAEGATLLGEGRVHHAGRGPTIVAPLAGPLGEDLARSAAAMLGRHGLDARFEPDAERLVWEKAQVNAAINAVAALLDGPNGLVLESPSARTIAQEAARECGRVAGALGVSGDWTEETTRERWESVAKATSANLCSTVQDLRRRRKSEIHAINGAIARAAREAGIRAPANELLAGLIAAREELFSKG
jgi:2-dehydropantoate 2-reductase